MSLLWRTYLANLILSVLLFGQQPTRSVISHPPVYFQSGEFHPNRCEFHSSER